MSGKSSSKRKSGLFTRIFWLLNIICAIAILMAYLSAYVDPGTTTFFGFFGLAYPFIFLINLLFFLYWLIRGNRKLFLSLVVILLGFNLLMRHIQVFPGREAPKDEETIKVLSYNVKNMANSNIGIVKTEVRDSIERFIRRDGANIACLQEYSEKGGNFEGVFADLSDATNYPYCFYSNYIPAKNYRIDALVILSKFPIINTGYLAVPGDHHIFGIYTDLLMHGDSVRLYNLHLESIRFKDKDYQFVEDVTSGQAEKESITEGSKSILNKLSNAFTIRALQTEVVIEHLSTCPYPIIICGDFNDTPLSYAYQKISSGLKDAFVESGHGLGNTFSGKLPPIRIDFIFYTDIFSSYDFNISDIQMSDHYPVSVYLKKN